LRLERLGVVARRPAGRAGAAARHRLHALADLLVRAEQDQRAADADAVARAQAADLHDVAVDAGAVGALEVGDDDLGVVELHLGVESADALVVEAEDVAFLAADGHGRLEVAEDAALVDAFEHLERYGWHRSDPLDASGSRAPSEGAHARRTLAGLIARARGPGKGEDHSSPASIALIHSVYPHLPCQQGANHLAAGEVAEPRQLPLGEVARARLDLADRLAEGDGPVEVGEQLLVAQRLRRLAAERPVEPAEAAHLVDEAAVDHGEHAGVDAAVQLVARQVQAEAAVLLWRQVSNLPVV